MANDLVSDRRRVVSQSDPARSDLSSIPLGSSSRIILLSFFSDTLRNLLLAAVVRLLRSPLERPEEARKLKFGKEQANYRSFSRFLCPAATRVSAAPTSYRSRTLSLLPPQTVRATPARSTLCLPVEVARCCCCCCCCCYRRCCLGFGSVVANVAGLALVVAAVCVL